MRLAQETGDRGTELLGRRLRLVALLELGDMPAADAEVENFARTAEALRQPLYLWYVPLWRGMRALMEGRLADCERHQVEAEAVGSRAHSDNAAMGVQGQRLNLALERGRAEKAEAILRAMLDESLPLGYSPRAWLAAILARQGRTTEARALLDRLVAGDLAELPEEDAEWLPAVCQLAEACELLGAREAAERLYPRLLPHAGRFAVDGIGIAVLGSTARYLGLLAHLLGRADEATEHFEAALAAHRRAGSPLLVAAPSASTPRSSAPASSDETGSGPRPCWRRRPSPTGSSGSPPRPR